MRIEVNNSFCGDGSIEDYANVISPRYELKHFKDCYNDFYFIDTEDSIGAVVEYFLEKVHYNVVVSTEAYNEECDSPFLESWVQR